jgi:ATP-dependent RNA helicase DeaD
MTTEFTQLNLLPELVQAVTERGYLAPMPIQSAIIPAMLTGQDVIGQAQTGTGKTAAFALPMLQNLKSGQSHIQGLVLTPTRELALQVAEAVADYGRFSKVRVAAVYGGQAYGPQIHMLQRGADIVVGTPGRLLDLIDRKVINLSQVHTLVLDEADEMLSMGFIEDIEKILAETPAERQTALFSATLPREIRSLADKYMHNPQSITVKNEQMTVAAIEQRYYLVNQPDKLAALTRLFEVEEITSALIFARTRAGTGDLANELTARGFPAEALNGDLSQEAREYTLNRFRQNKIKVLVATDVAARGLDIDDISHVFNYDLPDDPEIYVHRIGRTGRAGKTGIAIALVCPFEKRHLREIEAFTRHKLAKTALPTEDDIRNHRENELVGSVSMWLKRGRFKRERELIEKLVTEGFDPLEIAAAALKVARADEKQRPIAAVSEVVERPAYPARETGRDSYREPYRSGPRQAGPSREQGPAREAGTYRDEPRRSGPQRGAERFQPWSTVSHEQGMVRLSLNLGKFHGIRPNDIVGAIASHANIPGTSIGKIYIQDKQTMVDIPEDLVTQVLGKASDFTIRRLPVDMQRA